MSDWRSCLIAAIILSCPAAVQAQATATSSGLNVGDEVEVYYGGVWIPGRIARKEGGTHWASFRDERSYPADLTEIFNPIFLRRPGQEITVADEMKVAASRPKRRAPQTGLGPAQRSRAPASARAAGQPATAAEQTFKVGSQVITGCWGADEPATVTGFEGGKYFLDFGNKQEVCGNSRTPDRLRPAPAAQVDRSGPAPASLPRGVYTCFASVPRYTGSSYVKGVGSVPQYSFTWQRQGTMNFGAGTWSGGPGGSGRFAYSNGQVRWSGGSLEGKTSTARVNKSGKLEVAVPVTGQGKVNVWQCSPGNGRS